MSKRILYLLLMVCLVVLFVADAGLAAGKVRTGGILTAIERDGSVVIDDRAYLVSPSLLVLGYDGERLSLRQIEMPVRISFEYEFTSAGAVIVQIHLVD